MQRELLSLGVELADLTVSQLGSVVLAPPTNSALFRVLVGVDQPVSPARPPQPPQPPPVQKPDRPSFGAPMDALPMEEFERRRRENYAKGQSPSRRIGHRKKTEVIKA